MIQSAGDSMAPHFSRLRSQTHAAKNQKELHPRSSVARRESFCTLDKDLSWKSHYRTSLTMPALSNTF